MVVKSLNTNMGNHNSGTKHNLIVVVKFENQIPHKALVEVIYNKQC